MMCNIILLACVTRALSPKWLHFFMEFVLWRGVNTMWAHWEGHLTVSEILLQMMWKVWTPCSPNTRMLSIGISSLPVAFSFFRCLIATLTSDSRMSGLDISLASFLKTSWKSWKILKCRLTKPQTYEILSCSVTTWPFWSSMAQVLDGSVFVMRRILWYKSLDSYLSE